MKGKLHQQPSSPTISVHPGLLPIKELVEEARYEAAARDLVHFLRGNPDHPAALALLGEVANNLGALVQAETFLRKAIALGSGDFHVRRQLASVYNQQERPNLAIPMFEALANERPDFRLEGALASMLEKTGQSDRARAIFLKLTKERPGSPHVWVSYGHCLRARGELDEAVSSYRHAIAIDDGFGDAWWALASIKKRLFDDDDVRTMRAALDIAIDERNIAPLNFALARALHDRGEYAEAFAHYEAGNRVRAASLNYDADQLTGEVGEIEREVDAQYVNALPSERISDIVPIFIVSLPRSGSTLLEQILGSHSQIEPVGELPYIPAILRGLMELATRKGKISVPQAIAALGEKDARALGNEYIARTRLHRKTPTSFFIDKLPHNWSNILFIRKILPEARFIDIRRPAMDCCFSNFTQSFTDAHPSSFTLEDVGRSYRDYVRAMNHLDRVAPGMIHHIDYTALVENPETAISSALDYLGLEWEDGLLEYHQANRVVRTPSSEQVRRPLNREGMEVWRPYAQYLDSLRETLGELAQG